jgi:hypothetical protein
MLSIKDPSSKTVSVYYGTAILDSKSEISMATTIAIETAPQSLSICDKIFAKIVEDGKE